MVTVTKRLVDWCDVVSEALGTCFQWLPPGTGHFKVHAGTIEFKYNSIPGDHFQVEWGPKYTVVYFAPGRPRSPERFASLQTQMDDKVWLLSLNGLLRRDPLLRADHVPNYPSLSQHWDTSGHWTEVRLDLSDTEFVAWKHTGQRSIAGENAARFPERLSAAADHVRAVIDHMNRHHMVHGHVYAGPEVVARLECDLRDYAHIDAEVTAEKVVEASLIVPFCEAVYRQHHKQG